MTILGSTAIPEYVCPSRRRPSGGRNDYVAIEPTRDATFKPGGLPAAGATVNCVSTPNSPLCYLGVPYVCFDLAPQVEFHGVIVRSSWRPAFISNVTVQTETERWHQLERRRLDDD